MSGTAAASARRAEGLGARLPPLLIAAERIAATIAQGVHGRRRVGLGDSFWQFRPYLTGDSPTRIDWRQSAKSDRAFVRETEWEAAQTLILWRDASPSMHWKSRAATVEKVARADLLLLALASLALRGGERVRLLDGEDRAASGRVGLDRLAAALGRPSAAAPSGLPPHTALPRHARLVLIGDFLSPLPEIEATLGRLAGIPVSAHLLQVLDPAETGLPYAGRVRFRGLEREADTLIPRVEAVRDAYAQALAQQMQGIAGLCAAAGFGHAVHVTDQRPEAALLGLYTALAP
jgi:uncharacterized protein (DUF58 family)